MALAYARALAALDPGDQQARMLVLALQAQLARDAGSAKP
jgi:hypothetical protein